MGNHRYDRREMEEILRRALEKSDDDAVTHEELVAAAAEVGISPEAIEQAAESLRKDRVRLEKRAQLILRARGGFMRHIMTYLTVNLGLFTLDILDGSPDFFHVSLIGWGIFLAMHAVRTYVPNEERLDRKVDKALRREAARERQAQPYTWSERQKRSKRRSEKLQRLIDDGLDYALGEVTNQLSQKKNGPRVRVDPHADADNDDAHQAPREYDYRRKR